MHHLDDMQTSVDELRERMAQAHGDHQEAGDGLIKLLEMLQEASRVQAAIKESRQVSVSSLTAFPYVCSSIKCILRTAFCHDLVEGWYRIPPESRLPSKSPARSALIDHVAPSRPSAAAH